MGMDTARLYKSLGTSDDVTTCDLCGRDDLKSTVVLQQLDTDGNAVGDVVYFGSDCGARATGWTQATVWAAAKAANTDAAKAAQIVRNAASDAAQRTWESFVLGATGAASLTEGIATLGGFAAARNAFRSAR